MGKRLRIKDTTRRLFCSGFKGGGTSCCTPWWWHLALVYQPTSDWSKSSINLTGVRWLDVISAFTEPPIGQKSCRSPHVFRVLSRRRSRSRGKRGKRMSTVDRRHTQWFGKPGIDETNLMLYVFWTYIQYIYIIYRYIWYKMIWDYLRSLTNKYTDIDTWISIYIYMNRWGDPPVVLRSTQQS